MTDQQHAWGRPPGAGPVASAPAPDAGSGVGRAAGTVMGAFVLSRALGLAREMVISSRFGTSGELDAYLAAFRLPDIIFQLMAGGALASAFIPTFAGLLANNEEQAGWRLASSIINILVLGLGLVSLICMALAGPLTRHVVAVGFDPERQALTAQLMRIMLTAPVVFSVSGVFMGILNSYGRFLAPALAPSAYNLAIILGAVLLTPELGVYGLAFGVAVGAVCHYIIQLPQVLLLLPEHLRPGPIEHGPLGLASPHLREVVRLMLPRSVGLAAIQVNFLVNTILASTLAPGSLATLNYAWILMLLPQGVFALEPLMERTLREVRTMLFDLRPVILEARGLVAAIEEYARRQREEGFDVRLSVKGESRRLRQNSERAIFAIVQEAIGNSRKHSGAEGAVIRLSFEEGWLGVEVHDDGVGFDVKAVEASYATRGSLGLLNMRERAEAIGGQLTLSSKPGQGTSIHLSVPV